MGISNEARGLSDLELAQVVKYALAIEKELRAAEIWASARGAQASRMLRAARREQEYRNALSGRAVCWDVLLQGLPSPDDFMGTITADALAPFDLYLHEGRVFTKTGQYSLSLRMIRDDSDQVERVAQSLEMISPYVEPLRENGWEVAIEYFKARRGSRLYLTIQQDGTSSLNGEVFPDLRAGLRFIQQSHFWRETRPGEPT